MSRKKIKIICITFFLILVVFFIISLYCLRTTIYTDRSLTKGESEKFLRDNGINVKEIEQDFEIKSKKIVLKSRHGHDIPVQYVLADGSYDNATMVLVHGHEMNLISLYPIADVLLNEGINVVLYDQRSHGDNTAKYVSFGYYERDDLEDVVDYVYGKMKDKKSIGLLGQSMGAATCGFYLGTKHANEHIKFAVLDCPYNNMKSILEFSAKKRKYNDIVARLLLKNLNISNRIRAGFWCKDMDVSESIKNTNVPILMYAMEQDTTCPVYMAEEVFDSIKHNNKEIIKFKEGKHIRGFYKENDTYVSKLLNFVRKYKG